jgi:peptidoglycan/xylan/chitin deacetylase (PgdA/CDA1 family)
MMLSKNTILQKERWPSFDDKIILTFDDGPNGDHNVSSALLDVLSRRDVRATFCYIGENIERFPKIARRAYEDGHEIAIHTYTHSFKSLISKKVLSWEIQHYRNQFGELVGDPKRLARFRPPFGILTGAVRDILRQEKLNIAYLNFFVNDALATGRSYERKIKRIKSLIFKNRGGAIVFHEMRFRNGKDLGTDKSWLASAVDDLIGWAMVHRFEFTTY